MTNPNTPEALKPCPPNGSAGDAIDYALGHLLHDEKVEFLDAWREGALAPWPDYARWLEVQYRGRTDQRTTSGEANRLADDEINRIKDHVRGYDTPSEFDARRRYTEAQVETAIRLALRAQPDRPADVPYDGDDFDLWSDEICALVDAAFETVSRNPSDHETVVAYRRAILAALNPAASDLRAEKMREAVEQLLPWVEEWSEVSDYPPGKARMRKAIKIAHAALQADTEGATRGPAYQKEASGEGWGTTHEEG
jgi:hypothetical protein